MRGLYQRAAEIFREKGGGQRMVINREGEVCMVGAVALAAGATTEDLREQGSGYVFDNPEALGACAHLVKVAEELFPDLVLYPEEPYTVYKVNDELGREAAQALLDRAAELEEV